MACERVIPTMCIVSGSGGLEVSVLAFGTQVRGFKPGRSRRIFFGRQNPQRPFFGAVGRKLGHVKEHKSDVEVATFGKILGNFSPIVPTSAAGVRLRRQTLGTPCGESWNVLKSLVLQVGVLTCRWQRHSVKTFLLRILNDS